MNYIVGRQYRTLVLGNILASAIKQAIAYIYIYVYIYIKLLHNSTLHFAGPLFGPMLWKALRDYDKSNRPFGKT